MKKKIIAGFLLSAILLVACQAGPETQAKLLLRDQMKSPDSFVAKDTKIMWQGKDQKGNSAYVIKVIYTAQNSFGAHLQECKMVAFAIAGNQILYNEYSSFDGCGKEDDSLLSPEYIAELMSHQFSR
jgi:hypothetical protein